MAEAEEAVRPIAPKQLAILLMQTLKIWRAPDDWEELAPFYREALEDVPFDLAQAALRHCRLNCDRFPKPKQLREPIAMELERRRTVLRRLQSMNIKARLGDIEPPSLRVVPSAEAVAAAEEIAGKTRLMLSSVELKRVPAVDVDDDEATERKRRRRVSLRDAYRATNLDPEAWKRVPADAEDLTETGGAS